MPCVRLAVSTAVANARNVDSDASEVSAAPMFPLLLARLTAAWLHSERKPAFTPAASDTASVRDVKPRAGLDFFWTLPDDVEARVEGSVDGTLVQELLGK